ncbi:MAG: hypothetical protein JWM10_2915 [Myxococcaceae bacterium]|nr:hypothetical protein [Myxococcaceae bacterium]
MIPWAGQVSSAFLDFTPAADLAGGLGIRLPSLTCMKPGLTLLVALGCAALHASAIASLLSRGRAANAPFNFLLVALSVFVALPALQWSRPAQSMIRRHVGNVAYRHLRSTRTEFVRSWRGVHFPKCLVLQSWIAGFRVVNPTAFLEKALRTYGSLRIFTG